jgi:hypothetical protein
MNPFTAEAFTLSNQPYFDALRRYCFTEQEARDLGHHTVSDVQADITGIERMKGLLDEASEIGGAICGDCFRVIPCSHADVSSEGRGYTKGH